MQPNKMDLRQRAEHIYHELSDPAQKLIPKEDFIAVVASHLAAVRMAGAVATAQEPAQPEPLDAEGLEGQVAELRRLREFINEMYETAVIDRPAKLVSELRRQVLEEAAQVIDHEIELREKFDQHMEPIDELAKQIRALAAEEPARDELGWVIVARKVKVKAMPMIHSHTCKVCDRDVTCNCAHRRYIKEVVCLACEEAGRELYQDFKRGLNEAKGGST